MDLKAITGLRDRDLLSEGLALAEGRLLVERLLAACARSGARSGAGGDAAFRGLPRPRFEALGLACVPSLEEEMSALAGGVCPLQVLPEPELAGIAGYAFHRGAIAWARRLPAAEFDPVAAGAVAGLSRLLVLPATVDPENLGSMMRSAAALGWDGILAGPGTCDPLSRRAVRVSMGAAFSLPFLRVRGPEALAPLAVAGWKACAAVLDPGARDLRGFEPPPRALLLIGNEFGGLGPGWLPPGTAPLTLPMATGSDSLNAAAAAALFLWSLGPRPPALAAGAGAD